MPPVAPPRLPPVGPDSRPLPRAQVAVGSRGPDRPRPVARRAKVAVGPDSRPLPRSPKVTVGPATVPRRPQVAVGAREFEDAPLPSRVRALVWGLGLRVYGLWFMVYG